MIWLILYLGTIVAANWMIATLPPVPVGFGLLAPAGVVAVGLSFSLRDAAQEAAGRRAVIGAVLGGAVLSALLTGPALGLASGVAFLLSESVDLAVYTPLRARGHLLWAVLLSNTAGLLVDSVLFLGLAFGAYTYLPGQIVGKLEMTLLVLPGVALWGRWRATRQEETL